MGEDYQNDTKPCFLGTFSCPRTR